MQQSHDVLHIGPSEGHVLYVIAESQPISLKKLADAIHLTPGAITQLVDGLVQANYVNRTPSEQDRRVSVVTLTPEGSRTMSAMRRSKEELFTKLVGGLTNEELSAFVGVQRKMLKYLEENGHSDKNNKEK
jgi:DNA-binding MarR family transcriptional regulator